MSEEPSFLGPFEVPPEFIKQLKQKVEHQHDMHEMQHEVIAHELRNFYDELNQEQLQTFQSIMRAASQSRRQSSWFEGMAQMKLQERFGICIGCNKKHDEVTTESFTQKTGTGDSVKLGPEKNEALWIPVGGNGEIPEPQQKAMDALNLDDLRDEDSNEILAFICKNCGIRYLSMDARRKEMNDEPDGCPGCIRKAKWG